jgi:hypothetical protein
VSRVESGPCQVAGAGSKDGRRTLGWPVWASLDVAALPVASFLAAIRRMECWSDSIEKNEEREWKRGLRIDSKYIFIIFFI